MLQKLFLYLLLFFAVIRLHSEPLSHVKVLKLGRIAYSNPEKILIDHHPLALYLKEKLNLQDFEVKLYVSYEEIHERILSGELHMGWLGTTFYSKMEKRNYEPVVRPVWSGASSYQGQWITRKDSKIKILGDLKGKKVAFVSESSSSGFRFPMLLLKKLGIDLDSFSEYSFLDKHSSVVAAILTRQFDAGACYAGILDEKRFKEHKKDFHVISRTAAISSEPLVLRKDLVDVFLNPIREILLSAPETVLSPVPNLDGFEIASHENYLSMKEMLKHVE